MPKMYVKLRLEGSGPEYTYPTVMTFSRFNDLAATPDQIAIFNLYPTEYREGMTRVVRSAPYETEAQADQHRFAYPEGFYKVPPHLEHAFSAIC